LLTAARTAPGEAPAPLAPLDLAEAARLALADAWPQAEARRIDIALDAPAPVMISADADSLRILMRNLLDNAIRYTPQGGQVAVSVGGRGEEALLTVDDSGPGIPAEERDRAFQRFHRGQAQAGDSTGSGLGLAIVANIAARHGALVALDDAPLGGLRVEVRFPLPAPPPLHPSGEFR
jgi:signal transduction histidine kinase